MNTTVDLLRKSNVFFLATSENNQPRVRPFGSVAGINGKLYISTSNKKDCFRQMLANPEVAICAVLGAEKWIRVLGTICYESDLAVKEEFLRQCPMCRYTADDGVFEIFFFNEGVIQINSFNGKTKSYNLYEN